jgi:hypothetical protein
LSAFQLALPFGSYPAAALRTGILAEASAGAVERRTVQAD